VLVRKLGQGYLGDEKSMSFSAFTIWKARRSRHLRSQVNSSAGTISSLSSVASVAGVVGVGSGGTVADASTGETAAEQNEYGLSS
jgi:hypothetical protein